MRDVSALCAEYHWQSTTRSLASYVTHLRSLLYNVQNSVLVRIYELGPASPTQVVQLHFYRQLCEIALKFQLIFLLIFSVLWFFSRAFQLFLDELWFFSWWIWCFWTCCSPNYKWEICNGLILNIRFIFLILRVKLMVSYCNNFQINSCSVMLKRVSRCVSFILLFFIEWIQHGIFKKSNKTEKTSTLYMCNQMNAESSLIWLICSVQSPAFMPNI